MYLADQKQHQYSHLCTQSEIAQTKILIKVRQDFQQGFQATIQAMVPAA